MIREVRDNHPLVAFWSYRFGLFLSSLTTIELTNAWTAVSSPMSTGRKLLLADLFHEIIIAFGEFEVQMNVGAVQIKSSFRA